ncbi:hypothetical protein [Syntrophomonas erecta]
MLTVNKPLNLAEMPAGSEELTRLVSSSLQNARQRVRKKASLKEVKRQ